MGYYQWRGNPAPVVPGRSCEFCDAQIPAKSRDDRRFCSRAHAKKRPPQRCRVCVECGAAFTSDNRGRPASYCTRECRQAVDTRRHRVKATAD